jgi:hypothetical protein
MGGRLYSAIGVHFIFNPQTGGYQGTRKINRTIELSQDGQSYETVARVTTLDPSATSSRRSPREHRVSGCSSSRIQIGRRDRSRATDLRTMKGPA